MKEKKVINTGWKYILILLVLFLIGNGVCMIGQILSGFGGTRNGSMILYENQLYYAGKNGGIYKYEHEKGCSQIVKKSDRLFGYEDGVIYYTYKNNSYRINLDNQVVEELMIFPESIKLVYSDSVYNSKEISDILKNNEFIVDDPYAIKDMGRIYIYHNMYGGYISVYELDEVDGRIDSSSEIVLEKSYSFWQNLNLDSKVNIAYDSNIILGLIMETVCFILIIIGIIIYRRKKDVKKNN